MLKRKDISTNIKKTLRLLEILINIPESSIKYPWSEIKRKFLRTVRKHIPIGMSYESIRFEKGRKNTFKLVFLKNLFCVYSLRLEVCEDLYKPLTNHLRLSFDGISTFKIQ